MRSDILLKTLDGGAFGLTGGGDWERVPFLGFLQERRKKESPRQGSEEEG